MQETISFFPILNVLYTLMIARKRVTLVAFKVYDSCKHILILMLIIFHSLNTKVGFKYNNLVYSNFIESEHCTFQCHFQLVLKRELAQLNFSPKDEKSGSFAHPGVLLLFPYSINVLLDKVKIIIIYRVTKV